MRTGGAIVGMVLGLTLASCTPEDAEVEGTVRPNAAGLVRLPCDGSEPMDPAHPAYCSRGRVYVRPQVRAALIDAAREMAERFPGTRLIFMDASGEDGRVPFEPHLSHGDGRQVDISLFYVSLDGDQLQGTPPGSRLNGYGNYEPPQTR